MAYLDADVSRYVKVNPSTKSGESTNKNQYLKSYKLKKSLKKIDIGPAVILHIGESAKQEYTNAYDFLGRPKKI